MTRLGVCAGCFRHFAVAELRRGRCRPCLARQGRAKDQRRGTASQRGYVADWRKLRAELLAEHPFCAWCGATKNLSVDHIVPRAQGGADDRSNLRVLCFRCNTRRRRGSQRVGAGVASKAFAWGTTAPALREKNEGRQRKVESGRLVSAWRSTTATDLDVYFRTARQPAADRRPLRDHAAFPHLL